MKVGWSTWLYRRKVRQLEEVLRRRLCEIAATYVRYGYRRLTVLLRREGWKVNAKRIYRLYAEEQLIVRMKQRKKIGPRQRLAAPLAVGANACWSMDFVSDKLADGRSFRVCQKSGSRSTPVNALSTESLNALYEIPCMRRLSSSL